MNEKRDAYVQKLKAKLDEWNAEIEKLKAKADQAEAKTRIEYFKQLEGIRAKQKELKNKVAELQAAGESAWEEMKVRTEKARDALNKAVDSAKARFK